ncbi:MAG: rod shape-determining protein MreC [Candidatus Daviesbacteria bacterium]|nr:MAG: rod shape-determining protein MreC [Candidatus Daviesbacteria bacterium]
MSKAVPNLQLLLTLILSSLLILGLDLLGWLNLPKTGLFYLTNPISLQLFKTRQVISQQFNFVFTARFASKENVALKKQLGDLLLENATLRQSLAETQALVDQQETFSPQTYNLIAARPIGLSRYLLIDKGSSDGVKEGKAVVFKNNLLGKVISASTKSANVELITDPDFKLSAFSLNTEGKARGIVSGQFGTYLLMDKILHNEPAEKDDLIYSEGLESYLPRGLILGSVTEIISVPNQVFKQAKVEPVFDVKNLDLIFVVSD